MRRLSAYMFALSVGGCASTGGISSGVLPYKDGAFTITTENLRPSKAKKLAYKEAIDYCSSKSEEFSYLASAGEVEQTYVLYFECI